MDDPKKQQEETRAFNMTAPLRIGTRNSPLALAQTDLLVKALQTKHPALREEGAVEIVTIVTSGDKTQASNRPLVEQGGKGLFLKEIEEALVAGEIDAAVHSMKDVPPVLAEGLSLPCMLPREDVRDAFFSPIAKTIDDLPQGAVVGTSSPRRQALILARRPDLKVETFRGNVGTRLQKLADGVVDATLLAVAGLNRLGQADKIQTILEPDVMLPAVGQGAVGIEIRSDDTRTRDLLAAVHCPVTMMRVTAERAYLAVMDGSCRTPLAALMTAPDPHDRVRFTALSANPDGTNLQQVSYVMDVKTLADAERLGREAGKAIKAKIAAAG
jgi:hydroxymethylbilane synthase